MGRMIGPQADTEGTAAPGGALVSAAFFRTVIERGPLLIAVFDDGGERWRSPAAERLVGPVRPGLSAADSIAEVVHPADRARVLAALADPAAVAEPIQARLRGTDGAWHAMSFLVTDLRADEAVKGLVCYGLDVTQTRAAEERERQRLAEHTRRLTALSALKSEFISIVSHELRTPLSSIASFTELLGGPGELTSPDAPDVIAAIARNADRMLVLVQDLRLLSQLETGDHAVGTGAVDMVDLTREIGDAVEVGERVVAVHHDVRPGPPLRGDEQLLRQLLHTTVGTVAACAAGDTVRLYAAADDAEWVIRASAPATEYVTDEQLLATPLPVLDDASRQRSAALSVLLARAIAQSHGGTLVTEVRPAETATVTVHLPLRGARGLGEVHQSAPE